MTLKKPEESDRTQKEAIDAARNSLKRKAVVMGRDGKIRSKDTIPPGRDPKSAAGQRTLGDAQNKS